MLKELSLRRLNMELNEFELFDCALTATKVLFKEPDDTATAANADKSAEKPAEAEEQPSPSPA